MPEVAAPEPAVMMVEVTNRNDFEIRDMYDGVPIVFPVNESVTISPAQAMHCFGYPGEDADRAVHMARRYGWGGRENLAWVPGTRTPIFAEFALKVELKPIYYDLVKRKPNDPIPADDGVNDDPPPSKIAAEAGTKAGRRKANQQKPPRIRRQEEGHYSGRNERKRAGAS